MNQFCTALCLLGIAAPFYDVGAAAHLESYLPESSVLIVNVPDYSAVAKKSEASPINDLVNDPKIREILKPLTDFILGKINEDSDKPILTWAEIKTHLNGQIVLGMDVSQIVADIKSNSKTPSLPSIVILANLKDSDDFADLVTTRLKEQEDAKDTLGSFAESEKFQGVTIQHFIIKDNTPQPPAADDADETKAEKDAATADDAKDKPSDSNQQDVFFGAVSNTFFITIDQASAHNVIDAIKGKEDGTLANSEELSKLLAQTEEMDAYVFLNAKPLSELAEAGIRKSMSVKEGEAPNPLKPTPDAVINALGLNSLKSGFVGVRFEKDNVRVDTNVAVDTTFGVGRLFRAYSHDYAMPDFVPESALSVNSSGFNLGTLLVEVRQILFAAAPSFSMIYQAQIGQMQQQSGIDFEKDFLNNFDDGLVCFSIDNPDDLKAGLGNNQQIFALKIKDAATFKHSLDAILATTPLAQKMERRNFSGTEIIVFNGEQSTPVFAMAEKNGWLLMSANLTNLQNAISSGDGKKSFWQSKTYAELGDGKLPKGGIAVTYNDFDTLVKTFLYTVAKVYNVSEPVKKGESKPIDTNLIGEIKDMPFSVCGKGYKTPDGINASSFLIKK
jgi:hypothetical protein